MTLARTVLTVLATLAASAMVPALAQEHPACSNATLHGNYAFTITGQILAPAPAAGPVAGVAMTHFDGEGNVNQVDHVVHNGIAPIEAWRPGSGTYHINSDCTGWMTITAEPTNPADGGPELNTYLVIGDNGNTIHTVVNGSSTSAAFAAAITSSATKVYQAIAELPW